MESFGWYFYWNVPSVSSSRRRTPLSRNERRGSSVNEEDRIIGNSESQTADDNRSSSFIVQMGKVKMTAKRKDGD